MTIYDLGDVMGTDLIARRFAGQGTRWSARFEQTEIQEGCFLVGAYGDGDTPVEAIADYAERIRGKVLVHRHWRDGRREYSVPKTLTV